MPNAYHRGYNAGYAKAQAEAADNLERLRQENAELREQIERLRENLTDRED